MRNLLFSLMLILLSVLYVHQAVAQKQSHKEYAEMKLAECNECHKSEGVAPNHDSDWVRGHRVLASKATKNCEQCHAQKFCLDCHSGGGTGDDLAVENFGRDYKPKSHRSDWIDIHAIKSVDNPQSCQRCHDVKYCEQCHSRFPAGNLRIKSHRPLGFERSAVHHLGDESQHRGAPEPAVMPDLPSRRGCLHPVSQQRQNQSASERLEEHQGNVPGQGRQ